MFFITLTEDLQNTDDLKEYTIIADRPIISVIENDGVLRTCAIGNIMKTD